MLPRAPADLSPAAAHARSLPATDGATIACPGCDLLQRLPHIPPGARARCPRCGEVLATAPRDGRDRPLALALAAAICLGVANATPLMSISAVGRYADTSILGGALSMWHEGQPATGVLVAIAAFLAPALYLLLLILVLLAVRRVPAPAWAGGLLRLAVHVQEWSMPEVMLLGILVALVKIAELATVEPGVGLYAAIALPLLLAAVAVSFDPAAVWEGVVWADGEYRGDAPDDPRIR